MSESKTHPEFCVLSVRMFILVWGMSYVKMRPGRGWDMNSYVRKKTFLFFVEFTKHCNLAGTVLDDFVIKRVIKNP